MFVVKVFLKEKCGAVPGGQCDPSGSCESNRVRVRRVRVLRGAPGQRFRWEKKFEFGISGELLGNAGGRNFFDSFDIFVCARVPLELVS